MRSLGRVTDRIKASFGIDLRTLALFRFCFGVMLIVDLCTRATSLSAHYTDAGVWPRAEASAALPEFGFSFHLLNGSAAFQAVLFLVAGLLAVMLVLGWRTRLVTILSWIMLVSLNHRNYLILQTSDTLLLSLLFWSIFLPLGARWSVDAALNERPIVEESVCSLATAAMLVQVLSVYFFGALLKTGDAWVLTGDAVYYALHFSAYSSPLGAWLGDMIPLEVQRVLTHFVYDIELYAPILMLLPFLTWQFRFILVPPLMLMHVGFALLLAVGIYPYLSIVSLMLLIPTRFWQLVRPRLATPERIGLTLYYDAPCAFCRKICLLLRSFLLLACTPIEPASENPEVQRILQTHNSWVVEDWDGQRHVRWAAMIIVLRRSWLLGCIAGWIDTESLRALGERIYTSVARHRAGLGRFTSLMLPYRSFGTRLPLWMDLIAGGLMLLVIFSNTARLKQLDLDYPWTFQRIITALLLNQHWTMFAPEPGRTTRWLFVEGQLPDGGSVDVYNDRPGFPELRKPDDGSGHFHGYRWRKYFNAVDPQQHWHLLAPYYCRRWNQDHPESPIERVVGFMRVERTLALRESSQSQWVSSQRTLDAVDCR